jgi:type IV secretory pathway VirB10-like protein
MKQNRKSRSDTVRKPVSIKKLAGAVLVLLAAAGVGMVIREFRFRSWEKHLAQAPKAVQPADIPKTRQAPKEPETQEQLPIEEVVVEPEPPAPEPVSPPKSLDAENQSNTTVQAEPAAAPSDQDQRSNDPAVKEQRGRTALAMIGRNPEADEVWIQTINDPSLSANARSNLIEDLNEDGLSYRNLTSDDLPVIKYRIQLIEELSPYAMDKTNADAFDEAHKDLVNMANRLARQ